jgi:hypothetical protein
MPAKAKKELVSYLQANINKSIAAFFDSKK